MLFKITPFMDNKTNDLIEKSSIDIDKQSLNDTADLLVSVIKVKSLKSSNLLDDLADDKSDENNAYAGFKDELSRSVSEQFDAHSNKNNSFNDNLSVSISQSKHALLECTVYKIDFGIVYPGEVLKYTVGLFNNNIAVVETNIFISKEPNLASFFGYSDVFNYNLKYNCYSLDTLSLTIPAFSHVSFTLIISAPNIKKEKELTTAIHIKGINSLVIPVTSRIILPKLFILKQVLTFGPPLLLLTPDQLSQKIEIPLKNGNFRDLSLDINFRTDGLNIKIPTSLTVSAYGTHLLPITVSQTDLTGTKAVLFLHVKGTDLKYTILVSIQ